MAVVEHLQNFGDVQDTYLLSQPAGVVFHAMLYRTHYPGDRAYAEQQIQDTYVPPAIDEAYHAVSRKFLAGQFVVQRLGIVRGPEPDYEDSRIRVLQRDYEELQALGREEVRLAWYGTFVRGLVEACGAQSPFVKAYRRGIEHEDPKASFWAVFPYSENTEGTGWRHPSVVAMMHYQDSTFAGHTVSTEPFSEDLLRYVDYCRSVFEDSKLSANIANKSLWRLYS
jgi:hypothetical protein